MYVSTTRISRLHVQCKNSTDMPTNLATHKSLSNSQIPYSGNFSGGKIFVSSEFLASLWKIFCGHGTVRV